ncbi:hypothetical protein BT96DRAFT_943583 [Gymnopus androsaceus JB14]|uniref:Uncharacterized protein n=1 Tax=Gymnopus androsaceus JB14 TaxID=1447944 RepID=A0A6A4H9P7_9AGAR|nr:hypothetical protein BT96DRAFT_943583 [Gymnopus androsaceus JB14]
MTSIRLVGISIASSVNVTALQMVWVHVLLGLDSILVFWGSKPDAEVMYKDWKPREWKLREERYTYLLVFDLQDYREEWSQTKLAADMDAKLEVLCSGYLAKTGSSSKPVAAATLSSSLIHVAHTSR